MFKKKKSKYLILDISIQLQLIIVATDKNIISIYKYFDKKNFVANIVPLLDQAMKENSCLFQNLKGIIVGVGPGSYVGTRLAVLTAKMLSLEFNIDLYQISSLLLLSSGYGSGLITPKIDAKNHFFYSLSLLNQKIILNENLYHEFFLNQFENHVILTEQNFKISLSKVLCYMKKVTNPHVLIPSYYVPFIPKE
ncbi:tRNA (adenosine(37)-N6)-threonylcarbamoyltransferase complex dimerization subunit type 1 TsaB [Candidatus Phytoplasma pini]|nr:tRNA (adenosine(37)-N6)-threonylcarbamoyltransferase complex dimerization subunit type 1 TsaB [Candidatus Phytoplasma pini]